jgi:hypothetical protein
MCLAQDVAPQISFDKTRHHFGRVLQGDKVSHKYQVTNTGKVALHLKEIRPDCGCTYSVAGKLRLEPDESTFIGGNFKTQPYVCSRPSAVFG